jgi:hypothetical protein
MAVDITRSLSANPNSIQRSAEITFDFEVFSHGSADIDIVYTLAMGNTVWFSDGGHRTKERRRIQAISPGANSLHDRIWLLRDAGEQTDLYGVYVTVELTDRAGLTPAGISRCLIQLKGPWNATPRR